MNDMSIANHQQHLGLELRLDHRDQAEAEQRARAPDDHGEAIYPEIDADGDYIHFEMVPMKGDSLLWLTVRRETAPRVAAAALRKIADLLDSHGHKVLNLVEGELGSFGTDGHPVNGPRKLDCDADRNLTPPRGKAESFP
jgi:hypothetical protein